MKDEKQINQMSPLTWAYVGDAVYELYVRTYLIDTTNLKPNNLHKESIKYVKARAQAEILSNLQETHKIITCLKMRMFKNICMQQH